MLKVSGWSQLDYEEIRVSCLRKTIRGGWQVLFLYVFSAGAGTFPYIKKNNFI